MPLKMEAPLDAPVNMLVIVAHPDDIEFGAAGSIARWTAAGHRVTYCIVTDGSAGSNKPDEDLAQLIATRRREQTEAGALVGVTDIRFLGYQDGTLQPTLELRRDLTRLIREIKPYRVMIMDPTTVLVQDDEHGFYYINHPDHRAAGEAALYAVFPSAGTRPIFPELLAEGYEPHDVTELYLTIAGTGSVAVDISDVFETKIASLLCHRSQIGDDIRPMIEQWDSAAGAQIGVKYAETFRVMRFPRETAAAMPANNAESTVTV
ncbi:MAG: PIG-L deacetylase family protein [bacterium]|nr:PIG-L deacetylase family protein [bacterium]